MNQAFRGLGVSSGVAFGRVQLMDRRRLSVPRQRLTPAEIIPELERFERAIQTSEAQLRDLRGKAAQSGLSDVATLLEAHALMLRDEHLADVTKERIKLDAVNAEWALRLSVRSLRDLFDGLDDDYFRERRSDVDLVGDRLMRNLVGAEVDPLRAFPEDAVVVAYALSPADTVTLYRSSVRGFITESGGPTSHLAILARDMSIPAVVGVAGLVEQVGTGDEIVLDGDSGEVVLRPPEEVRSRFSLVERARQAREQALLGERELPAETGDGVRVRLLGNIEVPDEVPVVLARGGEGIGLYRTEFMVLEKKHLPDTSEQLVEYEKVLEHLEGRPLTVRTIDLGGDKLARVTANTSSGAHVLNPALGLRALRLSARDPAGLSAQLEAVLRASARGSVRLLLPFVTGVEEVRAVKLRLGELERTLRSAGVPIGERISVGAMIETPAAVEVADLLAREVDFFSVGTNDLIQYTLAVDRSNEDVAHLYRPCHPAVIRMLKRIVDVAEAASIDLTVCGEMAAEPLHTPLLIGLGVRSLSVNAPAIPRVKRVVRRVLATDCAELAGRVLRFSTAEEVEQTLRVALETWAEDVFSGETGDLPSLLL